MNIEFKYLSENSQNEATNYWFKVDGDYWAVSDTRWALRLLDCDGCQVEECNDHGNILEALMPHYEKEI